MSRPSPRRTRRPSADVRALVLDAARALFLSQGFEATTTKQIAEHAGVVEHLLFTNFGSKAALFEIAVLEPISGFVSDYVTSWKTAGIEGLEQRVDAFVRGLYTMAKRDRTVLLAALARRLDPEAAEEPDVIDHVASTLQGLRGVSDLDRFADVDPSAAVAAVLGMVLGVALLDDLLFPRGSRRPSQERLITELEKFVLYGTTRRADADRRPGNP
jgi:AcrR family transcriptional regulator